jgi:hypothetical protein
MIATKIGFFAFRVQFDPLKLRFSQFLFYHFLHKIVRSKIFFIGIGHIVDIILKTALEAVGDENRAKFSKPILSP